jgi:hypothetical protein
MNRTTLVIVAVTAAITTVIAWLLRSALPILDAIIPISETSERLRKTLAIKSNRAIFGDVALLLFVAVQLDLFMFDTSPITRRSIVYAVALGFVITVGVLILAFDISMRRIRKALSKIEETHLDA